MPPGDPRDFSMTRETRAISDAILENPNDEVSYLAYFDWRGDSGLFDPRELTPFIKEKIPNMPDGLFLAQRLFSLRNETLESAQAFIERLSLILKDASKEELERTFRAIPLGVPDGDNPLKTGQNFLDRLVKDNQEGNPDTINVSQYARYMIKGPDDSATDTNSDFTIEAEPCQGEFLDLSVEQLGLPSGATFAQIIRKAYTLITGNPDPNPKQNESDPDTNENFNINNYGEILCPPEAGPRLRWMYQKKQPFNEYLVLVQKPITGSGGGPRVFYLGRDSGGLWLDTLWPFPGYRYSSDRRFLFFRGK